MADGVAADAQVPGAPLIRPIPALHLHYANALLAELGQRGPIPLSVLLDEVDDVERLFKSEREHRSPLERARQLMRYAQELGLVRHDGGELSLTDAGLRYVAAIDPAEVFAMTPDQEGILYEQIREGVRAGNGIARGVALTLAILGEQADPDGLPDEALGEVLARRGGMASWREPRTFRSQGRRYRALTQDAGLLRSNKLDQLRGRTVTLTAKEAGMRLGSEAGSRAWIVRAGRNGAYEWLALSEGVSLIGWSELGELPPDLTREALKARIRSTYREQRERSVASQAGQVYRFAQEIAVGDVVVLPLLRDPRHVAVGRVRGGYEHRDDGPFAGVDAQHTRPVEWVAQRVGYNRFDQDLRAAFAQQGTVSEIGAPHAAERILAAAQAGAIHLVLKWSTRLGADTIERHLEVEREHGAVWWGRVSRPGATGLSSKWVDALREQVADGVPTSVFLRGATTWAGRLLAITTDRAEVEEALVPAYYDPATHHSLWVKLTELREVDEGEILSGYVLAQTGNPVTAGGLGNQTPLILRGPPRDTTAIPAGEARAARPEAPTAMPVEEPFDEPAAPPRSPDGGGTAPPRPSAPAPRRTAPARPLDLETVRRAAARHDLELEDDVYAHVVAVLQSGKHLILTGPPGTAKTTLATAVAEAAAEVGMCRGHVPTTATADWTTNETIGGLRPTPNGELAFEEGHFVTAIAEERWLLIDELNRSQFDRAFGQLFTVLSGHRVVLPYRRANGNGNGPLALVPHADRAPRDGLDVIPIPASWRIVATMNVFDKTLLFEMSFALMRRFGFVEVGCPGEETFGSLIDRSADGDERAAGLARRLLGVRRFKDVGPAVFMDLARFLRQRVALGPVEDEQLLFEAFYSYLLPQFEGIQGRAGAQLHDAVAQLVGPERRERLRETFTAVLGLELTDDAAAELAEEDDAGPPDAS